jgi:hypothetical protein
MAAARAFASDAFLAAVVADGQDIKAVSHLGRTIPERLRTAVVARDPICVVPGCGEHEGLEINHIIPVHHRGRTLLKNLCRLCEWHHYLKTYHGYMVDRVGGEWIWYGPNGRRRIRCPATGTGEGTLGPGQLLAVWFSSCSRRKSTVLRSPSLRSTMGAQPSTFLARALFKQLRWSSPARGGS